MSVYIEPIAVQNLLLTYAIAATTYRILRLRKSWWRLLLAAMTGSAASVFYPLFRWPMYISVLLIAAVGALLSCILFAGKYTYWRGAAVFFSVTFAFGGCVYAVGWIRFGRAPNASQATFPAVFSVTCLSALAFYYAWKGLSVAVLRHRDTAPRVYRYRLYLAGRELDGNGFMDTGNRLYDPRSGLPVILLTVKTILPLLSEAETTALLTGHADRVFAGAHRLRCGGLGGRADIWVIEPEKFAVCFETDKNILCDVAIGLSFTDLGGKEGYDAILHPALWETA